MNMRADTRGMKTPPMAPATLSNPILTVDGWVLTNTVDERNGLVRFTSVEGVTSWVSVSDLTHR